MYQNEYLGSDFFRLRCVECGEETAIVDKFELDQMNDSGYGPTDVCHSCAGKFGLDVDNPFFLAQPDDILTFKDHEETYHNDCYSTDTGYTNLYITEVKLLSIKVTDGLRF